TVVFVNGAGIATVPITGGGFTQITSDNGFDPSYTADGSTIVYQVGNTLRRVAATGGSSTTISGAPPGCADEPEVSPPGSRMAVLNVNGIGRADFTTSTTLDENYWAPATSTSGSTTTTSTTPPPTCVGTLTGSAFKGANPKPKKALAGVTVVATPTLSGTAASATTNAAGSYSMSVPCGTYTKTSTGPDAKTRVCHFGSKSGPTTATATVTNGSVDIENLFCKKK